MDLQFTEDERAFRDEVRSHLLANIPERIRAAVYEERPPSRAWTVDSADSQSRRLCGAALAARMGGA